MNIETQAKNHLDQAYFYYEEIEDFDKALVECDAAIDLDPYLADAYNLRGVILEELGRSLEALSAYKEAIRLDRNFSEAKENLSALKIEFTAQNRLVTIATFSHPTEAYIPKTKLEAEGVWSFVADADTITMNWLYSNAIGGVKLKVREEDVEKALEILNREAEPIEWDEEDTEEDDEERCPQCGSNNTYYEKYALRLIFLTWLILSFPIPFLKRKWKCKDCGHMWKVKEKQEEKVGFEV